MGVWILLSVAFVLVAWTFGAIHGAEGSRAKHYQDCMAKLGYDPVATPVGGISGDILPGQEFVLFPACPERRRVVEVLAIEPGGLPEAPLPMARLAHRGRPDHFVPVQWLRDNAARFRGLS